MPSFGIMFLHVLSIFFLLTTGLTKDTSSNSPSCQLSLFAHIPSSAQLPNPSVLSPRTTAQLQCGAACPSSSSLTAPLRIDDAFLFRNVSSGSYLLDVWGGGWVFAPLRIDVECGRKGEESGVDNAGVSGVGEVNAWGTFRGHEWSNKGELVEVRSERLHGQLVHALDLRVLGQKQYYAERVGFSPLGLLKNPMILIAGVTLALVVGMPYLMDNMDPETKAEFERAQKSGGPLAALTAGGSGDAATRGRGNGNGHRDGARSGSRSASQQRLGSEARNPPSNPLQNFDAAAWLAGSKK